MALGYQCSDFEPKKDTPVNNNPPPSFTENIQKNPSFRQNIQKKMRFFGYFAQFSAKTLLDWVRPPPLSAKSPKKSEFFLLRKFWIRRDPPPLFGQCPKKTSFCRLIAPLIQLLRTD